MSRCRPYRWLMAVAVAAGCLIATVRPAGAVEEAERFLDAIRDPDGRFGYYDTALEYLTMMQTSPLVDQEFKDAIDYQAGITWIMDAAATLDPSSRQTDLERAEEQFRRFLAAHPDHSLAPEAKSQLANALLNLGQLRLDAAARPSATAAEQTRLRAEARDRFQSAQKILVELEERYSEENRGFSEVIDPRDTETLRRRDEVASRLVAVRLGVAQMTYRIAGTYEPKSTEYIDRLAAAAKAYNAIYKKYYVEYSLFAGLEARLWEGRCYSHMGEADKAFDAFEDLLTCPDDPAPFRLLKSKALVALMETALLPNIGKYQKALDAAAEWEKTSRGSEESSADGLAIKYLAAEAAFAQAATLKEKSDEPARRQLLAQAQRLFDFVARYPGEYRGQAREAGRRPELAGDNAAATEPATFADACDRTRAALDRAQDPDLSKDEVAVARQEAVRWCRTAIAMWTPEGTIDELNLMRYYLAYLYYASDDLDEASVVGDVLARRYADTAAGREGARIALAACVRLYNEAPPGDRRFESDRMNDTAEYIAKQWQGESLAAEAWMTLIRTALGEGDLDRAERYVAMVPADSPQRGEIELMTGQRLWAAYLADSRKPDVERPDQEALDAMVAEAQTTLEHGITRLQKAVDQGAEIGPNLAAGVLSLAQICIGTGDPEKAVRWLEDPKIGPLTLVAKKDPVATEGNFQVETYKAALQAYVAIQAVDKAKEAMKRLEESTKGGDDAEAGKRLTRIYLSLGRELQDQIERLRQQRKADQLQKVTEAFGDFLDRIREGQGNTFSSLNWVAETFYNLGAGFDPGGESPDPKALEYYEKAADTYRRVLDRCDDPAFGAPKDAAVGVKIRLARCLRRLGQKDPADFDEAMKLLVEILRVRNTMVDAQIEAAYVYQSRGERDARYYPLAIAGGQRIEKADGSVVALVWGWAKLAAVVAGRPQYESIFHQARYNLAWCRFKQALSQRDADEKAKLLGQAETDIRAVYRLYPDMGKGLSIEPGGKDWQTKYDDLLRTIQKLRGQPANGLKGLRS